MTPYVRATCRSPQYRRRSIRLKGYDYAQTRAAAHAQLEAVDAPPAALLRQVFPQPGQPLPDGWRWVRLGEVCDLQYGSRLAEEARRPGSVPVYGSNGIIGYHDTPLTSGPTVIVGGKGSIGQVHYSDVPCFPINTAYYIDSAKLPLDLRWLAYILPMLGLSELNRSNGVPTLHRGDAHKQMLPLPPLAEQKRIAAVLREQMACVEQARAAAQARLEAVEALPAALLRQAFPQPGQPLPDGWRWVRLGDVCYEDRQIVEAHSQEAKDLPYLSLEHVEANTGKILREPHSLIEDEGLSTNFRFTPEHVLYGKLRPYLNKVALPHINGRCTTEMIPLRSNGKIIREFLAIVLRRRETVEYAMQGKTGSRMPRADMNHLLALEIPLPLLSEQKRIVEVLREQMAAVDKARAAAEAELEAINALSAALLRRAFMGEL